MKTCFAHNYAIPFETFFQNTHKSCDIEIHIDHKIEVDGKCIHKAIDFPGGPVLEIFEDNNIFTLQYDQYRARLHKNRIEMSGPIADVGRVTQVLERVLLPIHLHLHFSNLVPLHGGAILFEKSAHVFLGESGAGKSTTVLELVKKGASVISDDLVFIDTNTMHLLPGLPTLRLLEPTDLCVKKVERVGPEIEKWWHLLDQKQLQEELPIKTIFILEPGEDLFNVQTTKGFSKTATLLSQSFGFTDSGPIREKNRFESIGKIAESVRIEDLHFRKGEHHPIHIDKLASYLSSP